MIVWAECSARFKAGRTSTDENPSPARPSTSTADYKIDVVNTVKSKDRRLTIAEELSIRVGSL